MRLLPEVPKRDNSPISCPLFFHISFSFHSFQLISLSGYQALHLSNPWCTQETLHLKGWMKCTSQWPYPHLRAFLAWDDITSIRQGTWNPGSHLTFSNSFISFSFRNWLSSHTPVSHCEAHNLRYQVLLLEVLPQSSNPISWPFFFLNSQPDNLHQLFCHGK